MTCATCAALSSVLNGGIVGARPSAGPPFSMMFLRKPSGSPFINRPSVRAAGVCPHPAAEAPSPRPESPWQGEQFRAKRAWPAWTSRGSRAAKAPAQKVVDRNARTARRQPPPMSERAMGHHDAKAGSLRRRLFLDHLLPALQVEVPHRAVQVDRRLFHALEQLVVQRPIVDGLAALHPELVPEERNKIVERIHGAVDPPADTIAHGHRAEERHPQIGPGTRAPHAERLAEVL